MAGFAMFALVPPCPIEEIAPPYSYRHDRNRVDHAQMDDGDVARAGAGVGRGSLRGC
jgi:hypothetical protein